MVATDPNYAAGNADSCRLPTDADFAAPRAKVSAGDTGDRRFDVPSGNTY
ncbi:hypothetical protein PJI17_08190 [Mycobacterium kansasii]|uniref:Uncharacterized protein n=1 Tax=Mycobacterium kansasii TaxID=1768 RepID=A0A1V3XSZ2_MYCKA|nr:hypothetical protein MKSMC1_13050 [Mycobacterium kansasii]OOK81631.1 hypothetical protein BZL30_1557 [Mycobacterium kansasii]